MQRQQPCQIGVQRIRPGTYAAVYLICVYFLIANRLPAADSNLDRPVAIALTPDRALAFIGNQTQASLTVVDTQTLDSHQLVGDWSSLADLAISPSTGQVFVIANNPPQILELLPGTQAVKRIATNALPSIPTRLAISKEGKFLCVSMTWKHSVFLIEMEDGKLPTTPTGKLIRLAFQPKELLPLSEGQFLVADAFGGNLAVVDCKQANIVASHKIIGHHIGGLARDDSTQTIAISHQRLSANARTTRDDIHWGLLMQNMVSIIPESHLKNPTASISGSSETLMLGDVGRGAADPSGLIAWDGCLAIAITGTYQIAYRNNDHRQFRFTKLGQAPARGVRISESKMMWISPLGNTVSVTDIVDGELVATKSLGRMRVLESNEERGEVAFFSGRLSHDGWMSCSSCHVDAHSPDLLADTKGDGRFDNAKRIPSLLNVAHTGPWAWNGSEKTLEDQIEKTIATSMHRAPASRESEETDRSIAQDIAAFLRKQQLPKETVDENEDRKQGQALFETRGCVVCHKPESHYTSTDTYDVNVTDELGQTKFNPPSLEGLRFRRAYFHDARYKSLSKLIVNHPDAKNTWSQKELAALEAFLLGL